MRLNTITELLNIPNHQVAKVIKRSKDRLELILKPTEEIPPVCSGCGRVHSATEDHLEP